jgi:hypothetical protein
LIAAIVSAFAVVGCGRAPAPPPPAGPAAKQSEPMPAGEIAKLPDVPTHWTNDKPIGGGAAGVTEAQLKAGTADPKQWLLYGGDYTNQRFSPIKELNPASVGNLQGGLDISDRHAGPVRSIPGRVRRDHVRDLVV